MYIKITSIIPNLKTASCDQRFRKSEPTAERITSHLIASRVVLKSDFQESPAINI